ncbi:hypothetical protein JCM8097_002269 [Rhodosporidiobolus ruineniae]
MATPPYHHPVASTSRTSLDDLARADEDERARIELRKRGGGGADKLADGGERLVRARRGSLKGKEKECAVELAIMAADGTRRTIGRADEMGSMEMLDGTGRDDEERNGRNGVGEDDEERRRAGGDALSPAPGAQSPRPSPPSTPPPTAQPPQKPVRPPLHSILKLPQSARTSSTQPSQRSHSASLLPLPSSSLLIPPPADADAPASPDSLEAKSPGVIFSTPGTTSSVLPLSTPSALGDSADSANGATSGSASGGHMDPIGTFRSWKSSAMGRRSGNFEKKRLAALGFEEELSRDYDFFASFGIAICNIGALPGTTLGVLTAFRTGGGSMYAIAWPISGLFMIGLAAVLGELASSFPVAGASFTWVFRLCRSKKALDPWARYASWLTGSALLCSHLLLQIVITWQFAHNLLGVITLFTGKHYSFWVTCCICWLICGVSGGVVSSRLSRSPWLWRICGALIIAFFITINTTILVHAPVIRSAKFVFRSYSNETGFSSKSYVYMIGWVLTCVATGMEAAAHMAEDTKKPSRTVPLAMFWSTALSYLLGWVSICVLLATMNRDGIDPDLQPSIALIANTIPKGYTLLVLILVLISFLFQTVAQLLATSRFVFALARESAVPFSKFFHRLSGKNRQPTAAIWFTIAIVVPSVLLLAIDNSIISTTLLEGAGITATASYVAPILLYLFCPKDVLRNSGREQWTLRGASKIVAVPVSLFLLTFIITMCLPTGYPITSLNMSYASVVLVGVLLLASVTWVIYGNSHYAGPIKTTTRWTIGAEVDLPSTSTHGGATAAPPADGARAKRGKSTAAAPVTTSFAHGRSAHVWAQSTTGDEGERRVGAGRDGEATVGTEMTGMRTTRTGGTESGMTESGWTEYSTEDGSYEDDDEEEEDDTDEEEEEGDEESRRSRRRRRPPDEERGESARRRDQGV